MLTAGLWKLVAQPLRVLPAYRIHRTEETPGQIDGPPAIGVTGLVSTNANVSHASAQTAAIFANGLNVSASGAHTVTENFADGAYSVAHFNVTGEPYSSYEAIDNTADTCVATAQNNVKGSGNLLIYANGYTMTSAVGKRERSDRFGRVCTHCALRRDDDDRKQQVK